MMTEVFYWVVNMSIAGAATGVIVLLLRRVRRLPRRFIFWLWLLPLIRFCLPFGLPNRYSLLTLVARFTTKSVPMANSPESFPLYYTNYIMAADSYGTGGSSFSIQIKALEKVFAVGGFIWLVVFAAALLTMAILYILTQSELRTATLLGGNVYISHKITSPALYGVFRPRIVIPPYVSGELLTYVELHENAHRQRGDNLTRLVAIVVACLHWFSPFTWLLLKCYLEDAELACDETVLRQIGTQYRKAYSSALVSCEERKALFAPAFSAVFGGAKIKVRIQNILTYQKLTLASAVAFIVLLVALTATLLTNAG